MEPASADLTPGEKPHDSRAQVIPTSSPKLRWCGLALMLVGLALAFVAGSVVKGTVPGSAFSAGIILTGLEDPSHPFGFAPVETIFPDWPRDQVAEKAQVWEGLAVVSPRDKSGARAVLLGLPQPLVDIIKGEVLKSGHLPASNSKEILAGANRESKQAAKRRAPRREFAGKRFAVVGTLSPGLLLFDNAYVTPIENLSPESLSDNRPNLLVILPKPGHTTFQIAELFFQDKKPPEGAKIAARIEEEQVRFGRYVLSCLGLTAVFAGSVLIFWGLLPASGRTSAETRRLTFFGQNLVTLGRARSAYLWANLVCFLFIVIPMFSAYNLPVLQREFGEVVEESFSAEGYLHFVSRAYEHSVISATLATFAVNFFGGTFLSLTVPSFVVPASGFAIGALRSILVGLVLAPSSPSLIAKMVPHSLTVALEMQGYIIAMASSVRLCEALVAPRRFGQPKRRGALAFAAKETLSLYPLIAVILFVAALYEAFELRHLIGFF